MLKYKICVLMSDIRENDTISYLLGIEKSANTLGFSTTTFSMLQLCELITGGEDKVFDLVNFNEYDGVIVIATSFGAHTEVLMDISAKIKEQCDIPIVSVGKFEDVDHVKSRGSGKYMELIFDHLIEKHNCQHIYVLGGRKSTINAQINGAKDSLKKHGLSFNENDVFYGGYWTDCAETLADNIAREVLPIPDAVVCINEPIARTFIKCMYQYNYRIPDDIKVMCVSRSPEKLGNILSISTVIIDGEISGYDAMAMLYNKITGLTAPEKRPPQPVLSLGISCGCGIMPQRNTRFKFEQREKQEHNEMLFRNSNIEEKLYTVKNFDEFVDIMRKNVYLISGRKGVSISLINEDNLHATCVFFVEDQYDKTPEKEFVASRILPDGISIDVGGDSSFTFVLPLVFNGKMYGFMTVMYDTPAIYDEITLKFAKIVSIAIERLNQLEEARKSAVPQQQPALQSYSAEKNAESSTVINNPTPINDDINIFANKNGVMCKVVVENILYFEAINSKIHIALKSGKYEIKQKLFEIEEQLNTRGFVRISKSMVLNMKKVVNFRPGPDRTIIVTLSNNEEIKVSRKYVEDFKSRLSI
ncbi:MAG: hypothetical protein E7490_03130 [Ruminococcaceae bacterium]|nr:hypothetical protein [Oscillospiraceae bacterium]